MFKKRKYERRLLMMMLALGGLLTNALWASSVTISWAPNTEPDLAGYIVHYGTQSGAYSQSRNVGDVTSVMIDSLQMGQTYYFAVTAYDIYDNESNYSSEVSYTFVDDSAPAIVNVACASRDEVHIIFSEPVDEISAEITSNYYIKKSGGDLLAVISAERQADLKTVILATNVHSVGDFVLTVNSVKDTASVNNTIIPNSQATYSWVDETDQQAPNVVSMELTYNDIIKVTFDEAVNFSLATDPNNYTFNPDVGINHISLSRDYRIISIDTDSQTPGQTYSVTIENIEDGSGNVMSAYTDEYTCPSADTQPPKLIRVALNDQNTVELEFSEILDKISAENTVNYVIAPNVQINSATLDATGLKVTLSTGSHAESSYTIEVNNIGDDEAVSNVMITAESGNYEYVLPDTDPPQLVAVELDDDNLLWLTFNERLDGATAENPANYYIDPQTTIESATLDNSEMKVMLVTASHVKGNYTVTVTGVKDLANPGNTIQGNNTMQYPYNPPDQTKPVFLSADLLYAEMIKLVFSEPLDPISSEDVKNYSIDGGITISAAHLIGDSIVHLETSGHAQGLDFNITASGILDKANIPNMMAETQKGYNSKVIDNITPRMIAAELQGTRSLKLTFNEPLDTTTARNKNNYQISPSVTIEEVNLDVSGKVVFLLTQSHQAGQSYAVTVQNIKDRATTPNTVQANGIDNVQQYDCESEDKLAPVIERVQIRAQNAVDVIFSEPVDRATAQNISNYVIEPSVAILGAEISPSQYDVTLTTAPHNPGTYTVYVSNVQDIAETPNTILANSTASYPYVPADTDPPVLVNIKVHNETAIELTFSETIDPGSAENMANYVLSDNVTITKAICSGKTVTLLTSSLLADKEYDIVVENITDYFGNTIESTSSIYVYEKDDYVAPTIVSVKTWNSTMLVVEFSEAMNTETTTDKSNYVINGNVDVIDVVASTSSQYYLQTSEHYSGSYILTIHGVTDASQNANAIDPYSQIEYTWNPADTTGPSLLDVTLEEGGDKLILTFDEAVDKDDAALEANYSIEPPIAIKEAIHTSDENKVVLFTESHQPGDYRITVSNIRDKAFDPNMIGKNNSRLYEFAPPDTTAPQLVTVDLNSSPMLLTLTFDEAIDAESAEDVLNYSIQPNISIGQATLRRNGNKYNQIMLETTAHQPLVEYTLSISGLKDRAPVPNPLANPISEKYTFSPPDTAGPKLLSAKLHGANVLEVIFDEQVEQYTAETRGNYRIDPSVEVLNVSLDTTSRKKVWVETTNHLPGIQYSITGRNVRDLSSLGNVMNAGHWVQYNMPTSGQMADDDAPNVARVEVLSSTEMDIIYNEPVDVSSALEKSNYAIDEGVVIQSIKVDTGDVRVHLKTSPHNLERLYKLTVKNIKDKANNPNQLSSTHPLAYLITPTLAVSHLNKLDYGLSVYKAKNAGYVDRDYTLEQIPEDLEDAVQVQTANDDKLSQDYNHLSFEINNDASVYVAYDKNIKEIPGWLKTWKAIGEQVVDSRENVFNIYKKDFQDGQIVLGGNYGGMDDNMYQVFVVPHATKGNILAVMNRTTYQTAHVNEGDNYYIDRDYTVASIPDTLKDLVWLKTANDDKTVDDEEFLKLYLKESALVHVAYDARVKNLPSWLDEWSELEDTQIVDSRGMKFDIYQKEFAKGEFILGGNEGTMDDNMYTVMVRSLGPLFNGANGTMSGTFTLSANYPNPFNPKTTIPFYIHKEGRVQLKVFNVLGQQVKVLFDKNVEAGYYGEAIWDGRNERGLQVATGMYFYRIEQKNFALTKRMLLIR